MSLGRNFKLLFAGRAGWLVASTIILTRTLAIRSFAYDDEAAEPVVSPA